ncbi:MAG TPA: PepSY-associated TM helix domain-containing protein [Dyella sp.]|uniref:PepSY-associated TM helix domain-containing protein n=1 Tax=Dyella sp. TaxID=1869338 RepID=UPI002F927E56
MKASTLRTFQVVHTWTGLLAGFALFIAFYAGALTVFHDDIATWQTPPWRAAPSAKVSTQALIDRLVARHPQARADFGIVLPRTPGQAPYAFWFDNGQTHFATADELGHPGDEGNRNDLADFVYALHDSLGFPTIGLYFMGIVSVLYGLALVSGVILHLPQLMKDLFAMRVGKNLKRLWQDAHNAIGVLSLPFHIVFALTGAVFCLFTVTMLALNTAAFDGKLFDAFADATRTEPVREAAGVAAPMLGYDALIARAADIARSHGATDFEADYLHFTHYGDRNGVAMVRGLSDRALDIYGYIALDAASGHELMHSVGQTRSGNSIVYSAMYALHFGNFGGRAVQWLYFLLGLAGAFLFYSGNLLWIESRRKRRHADQPLKTRVMARATVGVCIGSCLAISGAFAATMIADGLGIEAAGPQRIACYGLFFAACVYACLRPIARATAELLVATGILTVVVAVVDLLRNGSAWTQLWTSQTVAVLGIDLAGIGLGSVFLLFARAARIRAMHGEENSVWAVRRAADARQPSR